MARMLLQDTPPILVRLRHARRAGDRPAVSRAAHSLVGMLGNAGACTAAEHARVLERAALQGQMGVAQPAHADLEVAAREMPDALRSL